jgi:hypothetical protein
MKSVKPLNLCQSMIQTIFDEELEYAHKTNFINLF